MIDRGDLNVILSIKEKLGELYIFYQLMIVDYMIWATMEVPTFDGMVEQNRFVILRN